MNNAEILRRFESIVPWKRREERAPHKPLLVLYALGRWQRGLKSVTFKEAELDLTKLLKRFGRPRKSNHPEEPFWRLQRNQVWVVHAPSNLPMNENGKRPLLGPARSEKVWGEFTDEVQSALVASTKLSERIAGVMLKHFPDTYCDDILDAVGLVAQTKRKRDPKFRGIVLEAYESRCAICGFDLRVEDELTAIEAAHIRWHENGGPDVETNGLALCAIHHRMFDYGAFTIRDGKVLVSTKAVGNAKFHEYLMAFHGGAVRPPQSPEHLPDRAYLEWHGREVFKGKPRYVE